jgi:hypothetical protein
LPEQEASSDTALIIVENSEQRSMSFSGFQGHLIPNWLGVQTA